jgi:hypothetical protein
MAKRLEKFMEIRKVLGDAKVALQPIKDMGNIIIEKSYNQSSFERCISSAIDEINDALDDMGEQKISFLDSEIEQGKESSEEE